MKSILFLRHAKSDWSNPSLSDLDRPLAKRGLKDAPRIGRVLAKFGCMPDLIISSPSLRTRQTVELAVLENGYQGEIMWEERLYGGNSYDITGVIHAIPENVERPMIVGHNPGIEETLSLLLSAHGNNPTDGIRLRVPTAGLAYLDACVDIWGNLKPGMCILRWFLVPRLVKAIIK